MVEQNEVLERIKEFKEERSMESKQKQRDNAIDSFDFEIGMEVIWIDSPYTIIEMRKSGALLRQNFSIGTVLTSTVPYYELTLVESN